MLRFLLTPRWLALHVATVAAIAGTLILGSWQMRAYVEQEERERTAEANLAADAPTSPLDEVVPVGEALPVDAVSRPVTAAGTYDAAQTLLLPGREVDDRTGLLVVTPLLLDDGTVVPVLRGWVDDPSAETVAPPPGRVALRGLVRPLETDADATVDLGQPLPDGQLPALTSVALFSIYPYPPNDLRQAQIVVTDETPDAGTVEATAGTSEAAAAPATPVLVPVDEAAPRPVGVSAWRHLSYAWQWWLFAAAAVVFWAAFVRSSLREQREQRRVGGAGQPVEALEEPSHQGLP